MNVNPVLRLRQPRNIALITAKISSWQRDHFRKIVEEKLDAKGEDFTREKVDQIVDQILDNIMKAGGIVELATIGKFKGPEPQMASSQSPHGANWVEREPSPPPEFKWGRPSQGGLPSLG